MPSHQPKAQRFRMLALLWVFPSVGALYILLSGIRTWPQLDGFPAVLRAVTFEQWVALPVLVLHVLFLALAHRYRRTEPLQESVPYEDKC